jgi:hypothetical protein
MHDALFKQQHCAESNGPRNSRLHTQHVFNWDPLSGTEIKTAGTQQDPQYKPQFCPVGRQPRSYPLHFLRGFPFSAVPRCFPCKTDISGLLLIVKAQLGGCVFRLHA